LNIEYSILKKIENDKEKAAKQKEKEKKKSYVIGKQTKWRAFFGLIGSTA